MFEDYTFVAVDKTLYERVKENARLLQEENNKLTYETMLKAHESMVKSLAKQLAKEEEE